MKKKAIILVVILALMLLPLIGCEKVPAETESPTPTATPVVVAEGPYKGLVITGSFGPVTALQAKGFNNVVGFDGKITGGIGSRNFWGTERFIDHPDNPAPELACKYFTVPFKGGDILKPEKYLELIDNGQLPYTWADNNVSSFNVPALPDVVKKVVILDYTDNKDKWHEDQVPSRGADGITPEWTEELIEHEIEPLINNIKNMHPDAEFYISSFYPLSKDFGHYDEAKYPNAFRRFNPEDDWVKKFRDSDYKAADAVLKAFADANGYKFIDLQATALIGADGYVKEEYIHSYGDGFFYSNEGTKIVGDAIMDACGLPKPN